MSKAAWQVATFGMGLALIGATFGLVANRNALQQARNLQRDCPAAQSQSQAVRQVAPAAEDERAPKPLKQIPKEAQEFFRGMENGTMKCLDGVVFRRANGGWENVPGMTCRLPKGR